MAVKQFFDLLIPLYEKCDLTLKRIFNCDVTGISLNPRGLARIVSLRGQRYIGATNLTERGKNVTAEICFLVAGTYVPPMLILPWKRMNQSFQMGLPPGAWAVCSGTDWITKELFPKWL